jgi:cytochrome b6-f complex iron-sulfur subunit
LSKEVKKTVEETTSRRGVLGKLWMLLGGAAALEAAWVFGDFFGRDRSGDGARQNRNIVVAGPVDRFEKGSVTPFQEGKFYLARLEDGGFLALSRKCTHLGCTVPWDKEIARFVCPCHTSTFDIKGRVIGAPAPRPLDLFSVRIENKIVKVDISEPIKRSAFSSDQMMRL